MEWLGVDPRRLGTAMLVFGLAGLLLAGIATVALGWGAFAARDLDDRLQADQATIGASLTRLSSSLESLALTTEHAGATLDTSSATLADAGSVLESASGASLALSDALNVEILGSRPFARASERLADLARSLTTFQDRATQLAANLDRNAADAAQMTQQIRAIKDQTAELAARVTAFDRIGRVVGLLRGGIVLAALLTAWVAAGAAFCAWAGWRLRRAARAARTPGG